MKSENFDQRNIRALRSRVLLLESAKNTFLAHGYKQTTIAKVAKEANLGYGTVYSHFKKGKEELFFAVVEGAMNEFYQIADTTFTPSSHQETTAFAYKRAKEFLQVAI
ncbi:TetR/AcrR family transcriptional regulator [Alteribacillus sp. JSM 102045]|uniref:TetR/AcrR family transcriptional regulator n=1 Tax=Alteribacillus sp. JSM 102045 TaxID=1562101 RepID=UPI0035C0DA0C